MSGIEGEIVVLDNASTDNSAEMVREKFPDVSLITSPENVGFARGNNIAIRQTSGDFILLINPDTIVQEDTFRVMLRFFETHPDAGLAGCKVLNPDGTFQLPCRRSFPTPWVAFTKIFGLSALFPKSRLFGRYNLTFLDPDQTYPVDAVSGSFMMIRRQTYEQVGGLDESFFMYGEDLDWCYRVGDAGSKVYYVHGTAIIHFKGQSTKRSEIDEIKFFYEAMQLFVEKHFSRSGVLRLFLRTGIVLRAAIASLGRWGRPLLQALVDFVCVDLAIFLSAALYLGDPMRFPLNAHPVVWVVPGLIVVGTGFFTGVYTSYRYSVSRAAASLVLSYVIISAVVFFAKEFAYSRAVVIISGVLGILLLPGWRLVLRMWGRAAVHHGSRKSLFGRRTVIVGTGSSAQEVLRKLRARVDGGYDVLGFIGEESRLIGERFGGLEVIGSMENVGKVIDEERVGEVVFSTDGISYTDILSVVARSKSRTVNFRLVPDSLEAIIGKTRIDELDELPLVDIEYNIHKPGNRFLKRSFDIGLSGTLLLLLYLPVRITGLRGRVADGVLRVPDVFLGRLSFVGLPVTSGAETDGTDMPDHVVADTWYLGPPGLTGLVQINQREGLSQDEIERYMLYYAKNQSLVLDLEILLKSLIMLFKK
jgi:GT2 family glycosyltransferase/lipopolysaccharide/colanic/teichoic acid biosynthesis glycosyltransferase